MKDYEHMIAMFSDAQLEYYRILSENSPLVVKRIYEKIRSKVDGFGEGNPYHEFLNYWETAGEKIGISHFDAEITSFLYSDPDFTKFVTVYQTNTFKSTRDAVIDCYITSLTNKNRKGFDRLFTLYHCYNNYHQKHIEGNSLEEIYDTTVAAGGVFDSNLIHWDTPFYEETSYKEEQLNKYLFQFLSSYKKQIDRVCAEIIFHKLFAGYDFKTTDIMHEAQKYVTKDYTRMQYYRVVNKMHKAIYEYLLNNDDILDLLGNGMTCVNGQLYTVKQALQYALDNFDELHDLKKEKEVKEKKPFVRETDETIRKEVVEYCRNHGVPYSFEVGAYSKALIKLKLSKNSVQNKYTTYVYSTGGFRDFKQGKKGYYKSLFVTDIKRAEKKKYNKRLGVSDKEDKIMNRLERLMEIYNV